MGLLAAARADPAVVGDAVAATVANPDDSQTHEYKDQDDDRDDLETFHCPECGRPFRVSRNALVAKCTHPRCGAEVDLAELEDADLDDDADGEQSHDPDDDDDADDQDEIDDILDDLDELTERVRHLRASDEDEEKDDDQPDEDDQLRRRKRRNPAIGPMARGLAVGTARRAALRATSRFR